MVKYSLISKEVLPKIAICGGVFCGGFIFVDLYKIKKNLK